MAEVDPSDFATAVPNAVKYYLGRIRRLLDRVEGQPDADRLLRTRLAEDMFDVGDQFSLAIWFTGRALASPSGKSLPERPKASDLGALLAYWEAVSDLIDPLGVTDLAPLVRAQAGEAELEQDVAGYVTVFALPNMLFHLSMAYAGLRHAGMDVGKADFDGLHLYRPLSMMR